MKFYRSVLQARKISTQFSAENQIQFKLMQFDLRDA